MSEPPQVPTTPTQAQKAGSAGRKVLYAVLGILVLVVVGSLAGQKPTPAGSSGGNDNAGGNGAGNAGPVTLVSLSGSGIKNTQAFTTTGPWTIAYSYDCSSFGMQGNFAVTVADNSGVPVGIPVNELGAKGTSSSQVYDTGQLHLEINSECSWTVKATQP